MARTNTDGTVFCFQSCVKWVTHKEEERKGSIENLVQHLRLALIKTPELLDIRNHNIIADNHVCQKRIDEAIKYHSEILKQPFYNGNLNMARGVDVLVRTLANLKCIRIPPKKAQKYWRLTFEPHFLIPSIRTVVKNNFLFVLGIHETDTTNCMKRFDARSGDWINLCPVPQQPLLSHAVAMLEKHIICAGGRCYPSTDPETSVRKNVWKYDIIDNSWTATTDLPEPRYGAAACTVQSTGHVWVVGGQCRALQPESPSLSDDGKKVLKFDSRKDQLRGEDLDIWSTKPPMLQSRAGSHKVCDATSGLIVAGGIAMCNEDTYCEMFSFDTEQWSYVKGVSIYPEIMQPIANGPHQFIPCGFYQLGCDAYLVLPGAVYCFKENSQKFVKAYGLRTTFAAAFIQGPIDVLKMKPS